MTDLGLWVYGQNRAVFHFLLCQEGEFIGNLALDGVWNGFFCTFMR